MASRLWCLMLAMLSGFDKVLIQMMSGFDKVLIQTLQSQIFEARSASETGRVCACQCQYDQEALCLRAEI